MRLHSFITRTAKSARTKRSLTLLGAFALLAAVAGYAIAAPRGPAGPDRKAPPAPQIRGPRSWTASSTASFRFSDRERGVHYVCKLDTARRYARCGTRKTYRGLREGTHTLSVRAVDRAGNLSRRSGWRWRIDTKAPPAPSIAQAPADMSTLTDATFVFADAERGVRYECRFDTYEWSACTSPKTYNGVRQGGHGFFVRAYDAAGNRSGQAEWQFTSLEPVGVGKPFDIADDLVALRLAPGRTGAMRLRVTNPNDEAILVTELLVTIEAGSTRAGCDALDNLQVAQSDVSGDNPLTVPAHGTVTLPAGGVGAPQLTMLDLPTNQDACKGASFSFSYSGSAHS